MPDDPEEEFIHLHNTLLVNIDFPNGMTEYLETLREFDNIHNLGICKIIEKRNSYSSEEFIGISRRFCIKQKIQTAYRLKSATASVLKLHPTNKASLRQLIEKLREKIDALDIEQRKKDALFSKLNAFAAEIDSALTRTDAFFSFVVDLGRVERNRSYT